MFHIGNWLFFYFLTLYFMKHLSIIFFLLNYLIIYAQPYFVDTLNTLPVVTAPTMGNIFELPNNQGYAVSNFANYDLSLIYTDLYGQRTGQKSWKILDSLNSSHTWRSSTKRADGSYLIVTQERGSCNLCAYGGMYCLNNDLQDTLWAKKYRYNYQGVEYPIYFDFVKEAQDYTIWATGTMAFNGGIISQISHLDVNGNIIAQNHFTLSTGRNFVSHLLPTADGGCIMGFEEAQTANQSTIQATFVKVNANGVQQWYKSYGNPAYRDAEPFILRAASPNEYWLIYTEGANTSNSDFISRIKGVRINNSGTELETKYLAPYKTRGMNNEVYQDADGSVVFGMSRSNLGMNKWGCLWKFNPSMDSVWQKSISVPNYDTSTEALNPYHIIRAANGDYICGGMYRPGNNFDMIFLTRLDSMGCLVVGTETVAEQQEKKIKVFPNPTSGILNIENAENVKGNAYLYNALGQMIKQITLSNFQTQISTNDLANGIYFLSVMDASGRFVGRKRVVVQHE